MSHPLLRQTGIIGPFIIMDLRKLQKINTILKREYAKNKAPILELIQAETGDPFKVLVATILSARTKDQTTTQVARRLFKVVKKPDDLLHLNQKQMERLIFPTGFYHTKARHLRQLPEALINLFQGKIPDDIESLCQLPGVGRKTANLVVSVAFNKPAICVDVHVHRISNRLGLVRTSTPYETEMRLRRTLPLRYWKTWNRLLVSYGQTICTPRQPYCSRCRIRPYCVRRNISSFR